MEEDKHMHHQGYATETKDKINPVALQSTLKKTHLKFWEIDGFFKCPVSGMCFTLDEQKMLLKKTKISVKTATTFEIHEAIVESSETENHVSRRADKLLNRKYGKIVAELLQLEDKEFVAQFKKADAAGDHTAVLWATAIHPTLPVTLKREIFGEIHMSMHYSGEERQKMNRKLTAQMDRTQDMIRKNKAVSQQKRALQKEVKQLKKTISQLENALSAAKKEIEWLQETQSVDLPETTTDIEQENEFLNREAEKLYQCNKNQLRQINTLQKENKRLSTQLRYQGELALQLRQETRTFIEEMTIKSRCDETCPSFDLCKKRILIVGGQSRMETLYRELIEASGGIFEYHDGYMKKGARQLECRLKRADIVLCPVNCNSHAACSAVKGLAKKHNKKVHMLGNSSLKAVSQAIWGAADGRHMIN
jgi:ribosomal protein S8